MTRSDRVSGDALDGTYSVSLPLLPQDEPGTWTIDVVRVRDSVDNTREWHAEALADAGLQATIHVAGKGVGTR